MVSEKEALRERREEKGVLRGGKGEGRRRGGWEVEWGSKRERRV